MPRTIKEIHDEMLVSITNNPFLSELNSTSNAAVYRLFAYIVAVAIYTLELLFQQHTAEIDVLLANQKALTLPWYRTMALRFQYGDGFSLKPDQDYYDNSNALPSDIEASKIIKYAAVNEGEEQGVVVVKIAGETNEVLAPITDEQKQSVVAYFDEIKGAGTRVNIINFLPDRLYLNIEIYRDPLVLDSEGNSIKKGGKTVEIAIQEFMKELPFNGEFIIQSLVDKLQLVEGVKIVNIKEVKSSWIDTDLDGYGEASQFNVKRIPVSGYYTTNNSDEPFNSFNVINYVV